MINYTEDSYKIVLQKNYLLIHHKYQVLAPNGQIILYFSCSNTKLIFQMCLNIDVRSQLKRTFWSKQKKKIVENNEKINDTYS